MMIFRKIFLLVFLCFCITVLGADSKFNTLYRVGLKKLNAGDYKGALEQFKVAYDAAEQSNEEVRILFAISSVYAREKKYKDAESWLKRIFDIPDLKIKDRAKAFRELTDYSINLKHYNDALEYTQDAVNTLGADYEENFTVKRARIFELQEDYSKAEDTLRSFISKHKLKSPKYHPIYQRYVVILFKQKKYASILKLLDELKVAKWDGESRRIVCYYGGLCAWEQGNYKQSAHWFELMPDAGPSWMVYSKNSQLGNCWIKLDDYEKAYKCFEIIYNNSKLRNYYRVNGLLMMAEVRWQQKKYSEARKLCDKVKKFPKASANQIRRAELILEKIGNAGK